MQTSNKKTLKKAKADDVYFVGGRDGSLTSKRIALVSFDWREAGLATASRPVAHPRISNMDRYFHEIFQAIAAHDCDIVMFAPWTTDVPRVEWEPSLFPPGSSHRAVVLGAKEGSRDHEWIHIVRKGTQPMSFRQVFSQSNARSQVKRRFVSELPRRMLGQAALFICGETNILTVPRDGASIRDDFEARSKIPRNVKVLLNPIHTRMVRWEMKRKRAAFSDGERWTVAVWNRGFHRNEPASPWDVHYDGRDVTHRIAPILIPGCQNQGVRVGMIELSQDAA